MLAYENNKGFVATQFFFEWKSKLVLGLGIHRFLLLNVGWLLDFD